MKNSKKYFDKTTETAMLNFNAFEATGINNPMLGDSLDKETGERKMQYLIFNDDNGTRHFISYGEIRDLHNADPKVGVLKAVEVDGDTKFEFNTDLRYRREMNGKQRVLSVVEEVTKVSETNQA